MKGIMERVNVSFSFVQYILRGPGKQKGPNFPPPTTKRFCNIIYYILYIILYVRYIKKLSNARAVCHNLTLKKEIIMTEPYHTHHE